MVKPSYNDGFTLLELVVVVSMVSLCTLFVVPFYKQPDLQIFTFANEYLLQQSLCMVMGKREEFIFESDARYTYPIHFNELGHIKQAQTIQFPSGKVIVIQLGGGRIEFK